MKVYAIKVPYVSNGLQRSYNKQLEVYEYDFPSEHERMSIQPVCRHHYKRGTWVTDKRTRNGPNLYSNSAIQNDIVAKSHSTSHLAFYDIEMAKASKFLLLDNMAEEYRRALVNLQELFERNVPDVSDEVQKVKEQFPEFFI